MPGCPPGLFTKQFAEFAPSRSGAGTFAQVRPQTAPPPIILPFGTAATAFVTGSAANPLPSHTFPYLVDRFFYTGASSATDTGGTTVGGPAGDGWARMLDFFEVPGQTMGATGPVARGTNFDWERQDIRPGLLNLNLIIDEEAFFSVAGRQDAGFNQQWLNFLQVPAIPPGTYSLPLNGRAPIPQYGPPVPLVVTAIDANGSPSYVYPITNQGVTAIDPILAALGSANPAGAGKAADSRIKAAFAQFLWLRHGGSGYLFGFGGGAVGQNSAVVPIDPVSPAPAGYGMGIPSERPFRSLSYPDIDYTVMRPATLPPSPFTNPPSTSPTTYTADPGVRNPALGPGYATQTAPTGGAVASGGKPAYPGPIPVRRLFQIPDANADSNASESGDSFVNNQEPVPPASLTANVPPPAPGALPPVTLALRGRGDLLVQQRLSEPGVVHLAGRRPAPEFRRPGDERRPGPAEQPQLTSVRQPRAPVLADRDVAAGDESDHGADASVRRLDHRRVLRGEAEGRRGDDRARATRNWHSTSSVPRSARGAKPPPIPRFFLVNRLRLDGFDPTNTGPWHSAVVYRRML